MNRGRWIIRLRPRITLKLRLSRRRFRRKRKFRGARRPFISVAAFVSGVLLTRGRRKIQWRRRGLLLSRLNLTVSRFRLIKVLSVRFILTALFRRLIVVVPSSILKVNGDVRFVIKSFH